MFRLVCTKHLVDLNHERMDDGEQLPLLSRAEASTYADNTPDMRWYTWDLSYWYCPKNEVDAWSMGHVGSDNDSPNDWDCVNHYGVADELGLIVSADTEIHDNWKAPGAPGWDTYHD